MHELTLRFQAPCVGRDQTHLFSMTPDEPDEPCFGYVPDSSAIFVWDPKQSCWLPLLRPAVEHTLVVIGCMGMKRAYLDVTVEEAKRRYLAWEDHIPEHADDIKTFKFTDEFNCYDAWEL